MGPSECLGRQGRNVSYQQVAAAEFGFDQMLGITAGASPDFACAAGVIARRQDRIECRVRLSVAAKAAPSFSRA
jgi:hypothetical protein